MTPYRTHIENTHIEQPNSNDVAISSDNINKLTIISIAAIVGIMIALSVTYLFMYLDLIGVLR